MRSEFLIIFLSVALAQNASAALKKIRFGITGTYSAPSLMKDVKTGKLSGIGIDIIYYIAKNLKSDAEIIERPRKRIDESLLDGSIDLVCYSNPAWSKNPETYLWSEPFGEVADIVVRYKSAKEIKAIHDLKNNTTGTVEGYRYGKAESLFESKQMFRSDFFSAEGMLERMEKGQIHYGIVSQFLADYYEIGSVATATQPLVNTGVVDAQYKLQCRMLKSSRISLKEINSAISGFRIKKYIRK